MLAFILWGIDQLCSCFLLTVLIGLAGYLYIMMTREKPKVHRRDLGKLVGWVSQLVVYPIKSTRPIPAQRSVYCDKMGIKTCDDYYVRDRSWMVALESGTLMTHRAEPKLALVQPSLTPSCDALKIDAPGMPTLTIGTGLTKEDSPTLNVNVWGQHSEAVHCGQEAADWICKYLGKKGFIIVYHPPSMAGLKINEGSYDFHKEFIDQDLKAFADLAPVHLLTQSSVDDVRSRLSHETNVTMKNFRPNIHLEGVSKPYDEDNWDKVYIGNDVVLEYRTPAFRCLGTTVDPTTGTKNENQEPLKTITGYRPKYMNDPCLGLFLGVAKEGEIKVGDSVYVTRRK